MKKQPIKVHIEMLDDGRMRARTDDDAIVADGDHIADLRDNVDEAVRALYGESVRVALMVGRMKV
jgi:hypothetical protein